jgi:hypothetical protein
MGDPEILRHFPDITSTKWANGGTIGALGAADTPIDLSLKVTKTMTLERYDPDRLDALSLRVLDICTHLRNVARTARDEQLPAIDLHDRKALEWLEKLEVWAIEAEANVNGLAMKARGTRLGRSMTTESR